MIYFDHNATTPVDPAVLEAMLPYLAGSFGNPSSVHTFGRTARAAIERSRQSVAGLIGARPSEIVFTSGGTESDNAALFGIFGDSPRGHLITSVIEHPAVLETCATLERRGVTVTRVPVGPDGVLDPQAVRSALRSDTRLISVMHANNELGTIQPVAEIGRIAAAAGAWFHCDAVQAVGKIPVDVAAIGADLLSLSAHKFHGPKGVGALFIRKGLSLKPLLHGGHAERELRAGTENVAGIVGIGEAARLARERVIGDPTCIAALRGRLERGLLDRIPRARVNGAGAARTPNTSNLLLPGVDSESLIVALDLQGLACSAGAACSSGAVNASHVLTAIGLTNAEARACIRLSLGRENTEDDVDRALEIIPAAVSLQRDFATSDARAEVAP